MQYLFSLRNKKAGFSLAEIIVVIGIIAILAVIVFANLADARKQARDAQRMTALKQIAETLRLYEAEYGVLPDCNSGFIIAPGFPEMSGAENRCDQLDRDQLTAFFMRVLNTIPVDPLGPGNSEYFYFFDDAHHCAESSQSNDITQIKSVVFANMEIPENTNTDEVCPVASDRSNNEGYYAKNTELGDRHTYVRVEFISCPRLFPDCQY